jgi:hypothetical protein
LGSWAFACHASYQTHGTKTFIHPAAGQYPRDRQTLRTDDEHQILMVMTAPAGSRSLEVLRRLDQGTVTPLRVAARSTGTSL